MLLQLARAVRGARTVNATVAVVTVTLCAMKPPAVKRVRPVSRAVTVTKTSTSVSTMILVTTTPTVVTLSVPSNVYVTPDSRSTMIPSVKVICA